MRFMIALATAAAALVTNVSPAMARDAQSAKAAAGAKAPAAFVYRYNSKLARLERAVVRKHLPKNPNKEQIASLHFSPVPSAKRGAAADELGTSASSYYFTAPIYGPGYGYGGGLGFGGYAYNYGGYSIQYSQVAQFSYGGNYYGCYNNPYYGGYGGGYGYEGGYGGDYDYGY